MVMNHCPMDKSAAVVHVFGLLWLDFPMENFDWRDPRHSYHNSAASQTGDPDQSDLKVSLFRNLSS